MRVAVLLVLAACDAGQRVESAPRSSSPAEIPRDASVTTVDPWAPTESRPPALDAGIDPDAIQITWVVFPPNAPVEGEEPSMLQRVDLEVTTNGMTQKTHLPNEFGSLSPYNQVVCGSGGYPLEAGELAKITFYEGGAGGFFVKRAGNFLTVSEWSQTDGACENAKGDLVACPRSVKLVAKVPVKRKPGAKIVEQIIEVDDQGTRRALDCELQDY